MTLTPQDVESQVFRERRRGYDPEEVDRFLDQVSSALADMLRERDRAQERLAEAQEASEGARESETILRRTLLTAERTAEQTVSEAQEEADRLREEARRDAAEMLESAETEAAQMRRSAEEDTAELRRSAEEEAAELRRSAEEEVTREQQFARIGADRVRRAVAELEEFREEYRDRVQSVIAEQLAALDRVGELPEIDPRLQEVARLPAEGGDGDAASQPR